MEYLKHYGDISAAARAVPFVFSDGKAAGTRGISVTCGALSFLVLPDRGMDIAYAEFAGTPVAFLSKTGLVGSQHYDEPDFLRSFSAGLLTTCGLTYMGAACEDEGEALGAHGRISNTPAQQVCSWGEWRGDAYWLVIKGTVIQSKVFGENVALHRTIQTKLGENKIYIDDQVENSGFSETPLMLLYHMNFGYPLVEEGAVFETNLEKPYPRDPDAAAGLEHCWEFEKPQHAYREQVFYHNSKPESYGKIVNRKRKLSAAVSYQGDTLPYLVLWKQMGEGDYVVGIEPGTWYPEGRAEARKRGELLYLQPQESRETHLTVSFESLL